MHENKLTDWTKRLLELGQEGFVKNGGRSCDTAWGPCECGATHNSSEDQMRVEKALALKNRPTLRLVKE